MDASARDAYLEAQIKTATPQKLRLMLIEAALRFARSAYDALADGHHEEMFEATVRCRRILTELLSSVDQGHSPLTKQVVALYVYLFQTLTEAQLKRNPDRYSDVIKVLEIERDTWRQLCERMPLAPVDNSGPKEIRSTAPAIIPTGNVPLSSGSFSLDA